MVATFLAGAVPADPEAAGFVTDYGRPDWSEVVSVVGLAVRLRLGGADAPPRYLAWGNAVRLVALVGLLVHAVNAVAGVGALLWLPERFPAVALPSETATVLALLGLSLVPAVISVGMEVAITGTDYLASRVVELVVAAMPVLALAAFHREAAPVRPRPWLIALPVGAVVVTLVLLATQFPGGAVFVDWPGLACVAVLVAALVRRRGPSWTAAIALFAGAACRDVAGLSGRGAGHADHSGPRGRHSHGARGCATRCPCHPDAARPAGGRRLSTGDHAAARCCRWHPVAWKPGAGGQARAAGRRCLFAAEILCCQRIHACPQCQAWPSAPRFPAYGTAPTVSGRPR
jgi:hypothetical protein